MRRARRTSAPSLSSIFLAAVVSLRCPSPSTVVVEAFSPPSVSTASGRWSAKHVVVDVSRPATAAWRGTSRLFASPLDDDNDDDDGRRQQRSIEDGGRRRALAGLLGAAVAIPFRATEAFAEAMTAVDVVPKGAQIELTSSSAAATVVVEKESNAQAFIKSETTPSQPQLQQQPPPPSAAGTAKVEIVPPSSGEAVIADVPQIANAVAPPADDTATPATIPAENAATTAKQSTDTGVKQATKAKNDASSLKEYMSIKKTLQAASTMDYKSLISGGGQYKGKGGVELEDLTLLAVPGAIIAGIVTVASSFIGKKDVEEEVGGEGKGWKGAENDKPTPYGLSGNAPVYEMPPKMNTRDGTKDDDDGVVRIPKEPPMTTTTEQQPSSAEERVPIEPSTMPLIKDDTASTSVMKPKQPKISQAAVKGSSSSFGKTATSGKPLTAATKAPKLGGDISMANVMKGSSANKGDAKMGGSEGKGGWKVDATTPYGLQKGTPKWSTLKNKGGSKMESESSVASRKEGLSKPVPPEPSKTSLDANSAAPATPTITATAAPKNPEPKGQPSKYLPKTVSRKDRYSRTIYARKDPTIEKPPTKVEKRAYPLGEDISMADVMKKAQKGGARSWKMDTPTPYGLKEDTPKWQQYEAKKKESDVASKNKEEEKKKEEEKGGVMPKMMTKNTGLSERLKGGGGGSTSVNVNNGNAARTKRKTSQDAKTTLKGAMDAAQKAIVVGGGGGKGRKTMYAPPKLEEEYVSKFFASSSDNAPAPDAAAAAVAKAAPKSYAKASYKSSTKGQTSGVGGGSVVSGASGSGNSDASNVGGGASSSSGPGTSGGMMKGSGGGGGGSPKSYSKSSFKGSPTSVARGKKGAAPGGYQVGASSGPQSQPVVANRPSSPTESIGPTDAKKGGSSKSFSADVGGYGKMSSSSILKGKSTAVGGTSSSAGGGGTPPPSSAAADAPAKKGWGKSSSSVVAKKGWGKSASTKKSGSFVSKSISMANVMKEGTPAGGGVGGGGGMLKGETSPSTSSSAVAPKKKGWGKSSFAPGAAMKKGWGKQSSSSPLFGGKSSRFVSKSISMANIVKEGTTKGDGAAGEQEGAGGFLDGLEQTSVLPGPAPSPAERGEASSPSIVPSPSAASPAAGDASSRTSDAVGERQGRQVDERQVTPQQQQRPPPQQTPPPIGQFGAPARTAGRIGSATRLGSLASFGNAAVPNDNNSGRQRQQQQQRAARENRTDPRRNADVGGGPANGGGSATGTGGAAVRDDGGRTAATGTQQRPLSVTITNPRTGEKRTISVSANSYADGE